MSKAGHEYGPRPVAIVGIGCRLPGSVNGPDDLWDLLRDGRDAIVEAPERVGLDDFYHPEPKTPGRVCCRHGGFVDDVDAFDVSVFGISPREAARMDPQHRLLLLTAWEALEDAGVPPRSVGGRSLGVFVGISYEDYLDRMLDVPRMCDPHTNVGGSNSVAPGRISYSLDLRGPSISVDTACSSTLVATLMACRSVLSGESELALVGGVNLLLRPEPYVGFSVGGMLAPDGRCKAFDDSGNGFVRSEAAGIIVVQPLDKALAEGRRIYAVVRGGAVNNDGATSGYLMAPGQGGQEALLRAALSDAEVVPKQVGYVECHGTGTKAGDPVEVSALAAVLGDGRHSPLRIGSVKSNLGHTEPAAGLVGLMKTSLSLYHRQLPPSLHCVTPNTRIPWNDIPVSVQTELTQWPEGAPIAGVSAFGIGGTNAHVVLQPPPPTPARESGEGARLVVLSGHTPAARRAQAERLATWMGDSANLADLDTIGWSSATGRERHSHGLAVVGDTPTALREALLGFLAEDVHPDVVVGVRREVGATVFLFPGQGSQWAQMGCKLLDEGGPFAARMAEADAAIREVAGWSVIDALRSGALTEVSVIQPAVFAVQVSLAAWWQAAGIQPDMVVGHSMGEVAAAFVAGALSMRDAARVICVRSAWVSAQARPGGMAVVRLPEDELRVAIRPWQGALEIAALNGPHTALVSGDEDAIGTLVETMEAQGVFCRPVAVDYASHCAHMDPLLPGLRERLSELAPRPASIPFWSSVHAALTPGEALDADYWCANLRQPVRFHPTLAALCEQGADTFVELSPHPVVTSSARATLESCSIAGTVVGSMLREQPERAALLRHLGALTLAGHEPDWAALYPGRALRSLPPYAWQLERFWLDELGQVDAAPTRGHPLLADLSALPLGEGFLAGRVRLSAESIAWVADHQVGGEAILPTTAWLEAVLALGERLYGDAQVEDLTIHAALPLPPGRGAELTLSVQPQGAARRLEVLGDDGAPMLTARTHARTMQPRPDFDLTEIRSRCVIAWTPTAHYAAMRQRGLEYGPAFQGVTGVWRRDGEALVSVALPDTLAFEADRFCAHPALLDACLQAVVACLPEGGDTWLPVGIRRAALWGADIAACHALLEGNTASITLLSKDGAERGRLEGIRVRPLEPPEKAAQDALLHWSWQAAPELPTGLLDGSWLLIGDSADPLYEALAPYCAHSSKAGDELAALPLDTADGVVVLASSAAEPTELEACWRLVRLLQVATTKRQGAPWRLVLATRRAHAVLDTDPAPDPQQAALAGLARVLAREHAEISCLRIDLDADATADAVLAACAADDDEDEWAVRAGERWLPRLQRHAPVPRAISLPVGDANARVGEQGLLRIPTPTPTANDITIRVDLVQRSEAGGRRGGCGGCGRVIAVGEQVTRLRSGDRVAFVSPSSELDRVVSVHHALAISLPESAPPVEPLELLTMRIGLEELARVRDGDVVLLHPATPAQAQAARRTAPGTTVLASAATPEARQALSASGIAHVLDTHSPTLADDVRAVSDGRGADVVLSAVRGDPQRAALDALAPRGRFITRAVDERALLDASSLRSNRSLHGLDMPALLVEDPTWVGARLALPEQPLHGGTDFTEVGLQAPPMRRPLTPPAGTILITGGRGGLGLAIALWLADHGAQRLALMGRSVPGEATLAAVEDLRARGVSVSLPRGDVSVREDVERVLDALEEDGPIGGLVHAAGVLSDGILSQQTPERFAAALAPKVAGAWNLHQLTRHRSLSWFVLFSSAAVVLGSPGQGNYVAANAFMDALAEVRRTEGLPALSIAWGPWAEVGLAAHPDRGARLARRGVASFSPQEGAAVFGAALAVDAAWVCATHLDATQWLNSGDGRLEPLLSGLVEDRGADDTAISVENLTGEARTRAIVDLLSQQVSRVLCRPVEQLSVDTALSGFGLDSLMAVDLKNRIERQLPVTVPVLRLLRGPSITALATELADRIAEAEAEAEAAAALLERVDDLDEAELDALLAEMMLAEGEA